MHDPTNPNMQIDHDELDNTDFAINASNNYYVVAAPFPQLIKVNETKNQFLNRLRSYFAEKFKSFKSAVISGTKGNLQDNDNRLVLISFLAREDADSMLNRQFDDLKIDDDSSCIY